MLKFNNFFKIESFECKSQECNYDLVINLNDENTIFVAYKNKNKILQNLFNPPLFKLGKIKLNNLNSELLNNLITVYFYVI